MALPLIYTDALGFGYQNVLVSAAGDGSNYDLLSWAGGDSLPSKAELDSWIANEHKNIMWRKIQAERDRRKAAGILINGNWFHTDDTSRIQHLGLVIMGANLPSNIMWKTMGGTFVQMTPQLAGAIFQGIAYKDTQIFAVAEQHRAAMIASPNPLTYNYLTGTPAWPTVFGE